MYVADFYVCAGRQQAAMCCYHGGCNLTKNRYSLSSFVFILFSAGDVLAGGRIMPSSAFGSEARAVGLLEGVLSSPALLAILCCKLRRPFCDIRLIYTFAGVSLLLLILEVLSGWVGNPSL